MPLDSTQTGVARGMGIATLAMMAVFGLAYLLQWPNVSAHADAASRMELAALAGVAPAVMLFICIARLAKHRFNTPQDIQGGALTAGSERAKLLQSLLQNTLEQAVLALPIYFAASILFPSVLLPWVMAAALLFVVGRLLFFRGYADGAVSRAVGFGLTFYPTVVLLIAVLVLAVWRSAA
jgi:cytochrome bd-type quinol oxidase subunit 2